MIEMIIGGFGLISLGLFLMVLDLQRQIDRHRDDQCDMGSYLRKLQQEHHDLRRQFLQLEIDFIVLQERSK